MSLHRGFFLSNVWRIGKNCISLQRMKKNVSGKVREKNITFTPIIGDPKVRYRDEALVILGKFCYNLAALVFGGVILSQVLDYKRENLDVILIGLAVMLFLIVLGWRLIKIGLCKIK